MQQHAEKAIPNDVRVEVVSHHFPDLPPANAKIVALDTWVWRQLARAHGGRGAPETKRVLDFLLTEVAAERIVVPLALANYMEVSGISDYPIRWEIAQLAAKLSRWFTFCPVARIRRYEIDCVLRDRFQRPSVLSPRPKVLGWGWSYAVRMTSDHFEYVRYDGSAKKTVTFPGSEVFLNAADEFAQKVMLAGLPPDEDARLQKTDTQYLPQKMWDIAVKRRDLERHVVEGLRSDPDLRRRVDDVIGAGHIVNELLPLLTERLARAGITWEEFTAGGKHAFTSFLDELPTAVCVNSVRKGALYARQRPIEVQDVLDADLFGLIVPYSDLVMLEAASHQQLTHAKIGQRFDTRLVRKMSELQASIEEMTGNSRLNPTEPTLNTARVES